MSPQKLVYYRQEEFLDALLVLVSHDCLSGSIGCIEFGGWDLDVQDIDWVAFQAAR